MIDNYIIGRLRSKESSRLFFGKVESISKGVAYGTIEKNAHVKQLRSGFEIPLKDVVTNLGPKPHPGKVYGLDVSSRFSGRKSHDFFGTICFMYRPEKTVSTKLWEAFDEAAAILEEAKLPQPENSVWEIQSSEIKAKWAGYYKHSGKPEKDPHRFAIRPESVPVTVRDLVYVILHEYAHYLHAHHVTGRKLNAKWVRLFNTSIKLQTVKKEDSQRILKDLLGGQEPPSDFRTGLEEQDRNAFNWITRTINTDHAVSIKELDLLFDASYHGDIENLWPKVTLNKKDLKPVVSEYATTNYKELFAESLSFYWTKRKLPDGVVKLVDLSLAYARSNQVKT